MNSSSKNRKKIIVWGGTGHCRVLAELLETQGETVSAIVDNRKIESPLPSIPILHGVSGLEKWLKSIEIGVDIYFAIAIGGDKGKDRLEILSLLRSMNAIPMTLKHHAAYCANNVTIGEGSQILAHATVCTNARIGAATIINTASIVDHDARIGDGVHIAPGACLAGETIVNDYAFVGAGAIILPRLTIGENSIVGAGAVVTRDVRPETIVVGNPAHLLRQK